MYIYVENLRLDLVFNSIASKAGDQSSSSGPSKKFSLQILTAGPILNLKLGFIRQMRNSVLDFVLRCVMQWIARIVRNSDSSPAPYKIFFLKYKLTKLKKWEANYAILKIERKNLWLTAPKGTTPVN